MTTKRRPREKRARGAGARRSGDRHRPRGAARPKHESKRTHAPPGSLTPEAATALLRRTWGAEPERTLAGFERAAQAQLRAAGLPAHGRPVVLLEGGAWRENTEEDHAELVAAWKAGDARAVELSARLKRAEDLARPESREWHAAQILDDVSAARFALELGNARDALWIGMRLAFHVSEADPEAARDLSRRWAREQASAGGRGRGAKYATRDGRLRTTALELAPSYAHKVEAIAAAMIEAEKGEGLKLKRLADVIGPAVTAARQAQQATTT